MNRWLPWIGVALAIIGSARANDDNPGSLWDHKRANPLTDRTAKAEGDLITILISESSVSSFSASTSATKSDKNAIDKLVVPIFKGLLGGVNTSGSSGATSTTGGSGNTTQSGKLTARLTAIVKQVLPNGTMLIEGTRAIRVNKETQLFRLSGVIRRDDIRPDNTLLSESLADARIEVDGKGQVSDRTRRGVITRLLDWLF